jgi:hypothetical protein
MLHICTHARARTPIAHRFVENRSLVLYFLSNHIYVTQLDDEDIIFPFEQRSSSIKYFVEANLRLKLDAECISIEYINSIVQMCYCIVDSTYRER